MLRCLLAFAISFAISQSCQPYRDDILPSFISFQRCQAPLAIGQLPLSAASQLMMMPLLSYYAIELSAELPAIAARQLPPCRRRAIASCRHFAAAFMMRDAATPLRLAADFALFRCLPLSIVFAASMMLPHAAAGFQLSPMSFFMPLSAQTRCHASRDCQPFDAAAPCLIGVIAFRR
jgi:hypothetical protein